MGSRFHIHIDAMAFRGYGVARLDGKVVFIPYSVTGDGGWVEIVEEKKNYSIGQWNELTEPSSRRIAPPCPHFSVCGGCQWQHIDYSFHGEFKKEVLTEILQRLGGLTEIPAIAIALSPDPYGYRIRVQLKVKEEAIGYYQERSHQIVDIDHCPISHSLVNQMIRLLRREWPSLQGIEEVEINVSPEEGRGIFIFHPPSFERDLVGFVKKWFQTNPLVKGVAIFRKGQFKRFGDPYLSFTLPADLDGRTLSLRASPESFFQINWEQNQRLIRTVLEFSELNRNERVLDLYSGIGNFSLPLGIHARGVIGIEGNRIAVEDARFNAARNGIENDEFVHGRVEEVLRNWRWERPDVVILDPPRQGCKKILDQVVRLGAERIVYTSCDPTTLARDLHLFSARGYLLRRLCLIDMFPQSYHMEVVALLRLS
jgi:23S rRNA (uracil1939-C5)-methyltransferase